MMSYFGSLALKCVTVAGAVIVSCAVARGRLRAGRHAAAGDHERAAGEALAATVAPINLACEAVAGLVEEVANRDPAGLALKRVAPPACR